MDLNEFKSSLDSEAQRKAKGMEKHIRNLNRTIREKEERIGQLEEILRVMFNRCKATAGMHTAGVMCLMCGERHECNRLRSVGKGVAEDGAEEKQE